MHLEEILCDTVVTFFFFIFYHSLHVYNAVFLTWGVILPCRTCSARSGHISDGHF